MNFFELSARQKEKLWKESFKLPLKIIENVEDYSLSIDPGIGETMRHHIHESRLHKAVKQAAHRSGIDKKVSCHGFPHSFATHLLEDGYAIRTIQELLEYKDVSTTMILYPHSKQRREGSKEPLG